MDTNQPYQHNEQTSEYSNQPGAGGGAPYQPPQQPQQPYGYQQAPPPPAPQKKGFNWLACCGITCLVLVIIVGGVSFCAYKTFAPLLNPVFEIAKISEEVKSAKMTDIQSDTIEVDTQMLYDNPKDFKGRWLALTGEVIDDDSNSTIGADTFTNGEFTTFALENNVVLMDISNSASGITTGDQIKAYGQCYGWDLMEIEKAPFFGKEMAAEMRKDPSLAGNTKIIFFMAKGIEVVQVGGGGTPSGDEDSGGDGWVR